MSSGDQDPTSRRSADNSRALTARGAATRQRIVSAAAELMHTQGVERTSLDDVIEVSGTGKSQLYHYFRDKDDLVEQVVRFRALSVLEMQAPFLWELNSMQGLERWRDFLVANLQSRHGAYGCELGSLSSELADYSDKARTELEAGFSAWESQLRAGLRRMRDSGELKADADPVSLATGLLAAVQGGYLLAQARRDPDNLRIAIDMALDRIRAQTDPWVPGSM